MNIQNKEDYSKALSHLERLTHGCIDEAYDDEIGDLLKKMDAFEELHPEVRSNLSVEEIEKQFLECVSQFQTKI